MSALDRISKSIDYHRIKKMKNVSYDFDTSSIHDLTIRKSNESSITIGQYFVVRKNVILNVNKNGKLKIGNNVFINDGTKINAISGIEIGNNVIMG